MKTEVFKNFQALETDRLIIRKIVEEDATDIFAFTSNPASSDFLTWHPHPNQKHTDSFIKSVIEKYKLGQVSQWSLVLKETSKVIGIAGFVDYYPEHRKGELAFILSPDFWGKGYMPEAIKAIIKFGFEEMQLIRIQAKCEINNFSSERVMQKIGMKLEGCFYNYLFRKEKSRHYKFYSIIAEH